jgi:cytochrome c-type biogenesis protein CcmH/NrfG
MKTFRYLLSLILILLSQMAWSADTGGSAPVVDAEMKNAREMIAKKDWGAALQVLERYTRTNPGNADGFNLLGYSLRNLKRYDDSLVAYRQALKLDPVHRGAHEYIGVAYIQMGQLAKAKEHLDALDKICTFSCEEYRDLKKAYEEASKSKGK